MRGMSLKIKDDYINKRPAKKPLSLGHCHNVVAPSQDTAPHSKNECMAQQTTPQPPLFLHCRRPFPLPEHRVFIYMFVASSHFHWLRKAGYNYWSTAAVLSHMVDPEEIRSADQQLPKYQALQPPSIV